MRAFVASMLVLAIGCGGAAPVVETSPPADPVVEAPRALLSGHGALMLRSRSLPECPARRADTIVSGPLCGPLGQAAQPPFYVELAADGSVTGTRCGAVRFTDEGELSTETGVVARVVRDGEGLAIEAGEHTLGWRIEGSTLTTSGARFELASGTITASDAELPTIELVPATDPRLALALFAALLVCDDVGP